MIDKKQVEQSNNPRTLAITTLVAVQEGISLSQTLHKALDDLEPKNRGLYHELVLGTLRHWFAFLRVSENLAHNPIIDETTLAAVHMGMYQLFYLRTPDHAAIGETVTALKQAGSSETSGLVNALLRKCQTDFKKISKRLPKNHSLPNWLAKQLKTDWQEYYNQLSTSLRTTPQIFLRVNKKHTSVSEYSKLLTEESVAHSVQEEVIRLDERINIESLPYFEEGYVSVQDFNAQKSVGLFKDLTDKTVLDGCAAPGGKTAQLLENYQMKSLVAVDIESMRTLKIADNLSRLGLLADNVHLITSDTATLSFNEKALSKRSPSDLPKEFFDRENKESQELFDAILLDAPCTATGVIRRHPDICLLREEEDILQTVHLQHEILANVWKLLKPEGELIYVTCSLLKAENTDQIAQFLKNTADAQEIKIDVEWGIEQPYGRQCLPIQSADENIFTGDGFYFAKLVKKRVAQK